tara:strand:+ start:8509 stop:9636 length:1128 start_codon:yes stop_codon:yes gene_type:complete
MADESLIRGAYHAAAADSSVGGGIARSKAVSKIGQDLVQKGIGLAEEYRAAKQKEKEEKEALGKTYDLNAQKVLDNSDLPYEEWSALYDQLQAKREDYINGDKKQKAESIRDLNMKAKDYADYKSFRMDLSAAQKDKTAGISAGWQGEDREAIMAVLESTPNLVQKPCVDDDGNPVDDCPDKGRMGVMVGDDWMDITTLNSKLKENMIDVGSRDLLNVYSTQAKVDSKNIQYGQNGDFNYDSAYEEIYQNVVGKSQNIKSLVHDEMIGGRSFYSDLMGRLQDQKYEDLGIDEETINNIEGIDPSDGIDADEASLIANTLINDSTYSDQLKIELAEYFTGHVQNNWNNAASSRVVPDETHEIVVNKSGKRVFSKKK